LTVRSIVVGILTHRDPEQVYRLLNRLLSDGRVSVVIHHDPRGPALGLPPERVLTVPDPKPAPWGSMGVASAQLKVIEHAYSAVPNAAWLTLISGADYPVQPIECIVDELLNTRHDAFVRWFRSDRAPSEDVHPWQARTRTRYMRRLRLPRTHRSIPFPRRHPFGPQTGLYVGDLWVNLNRRAMAHVLSQYQRRRDLVRYFSRCSVPDEALLPTLLLNDSPGFDIEPDHRRYIQWDPGSPHPRVLGTEDVDAVLESRAFFARKFDPVRSREAMDLIDDHLDRSGPGLL